MKKLLATLALLPLLLLGGAGVHAQSHTDKETAADVQRHRAMAAAHEAAAQCLESGKGEAKYQPCQGRHAPGRGRSGGRRDGCGGECRSRCSRSGDRLAAISAKTVFFS